MLAQHKHEPAGALRCKQHSKHAIRHILQMLNVSCIASIIQNIVGTCTIIIIEADET